MRVVVERASCCVQDINDTCAHSCKLSPSPCLFPQYCRTQNAGSRDGKRQAELIRIVPTKDLQQVFIPARLGVPLVRDKECENEIEILGKMEVIRNMTDEERGLRTKQKKKIGRIMKVPHMVEEGKDEDVDIEEDKVGTTY